MRVLAVLVGATTRTGGPPAFVGGAARELARLGHEMPVLSTDLAMAPHGLWQRRQRAAGPDEIHPDLAAVDLAVARARPPRRLAHAPGLRRALAREAAKADVVHIHNLWLYPQFAAFRAARAAGVPYVVSPHGSLDHYLRATGRMRKRLTSMAWQDRMLEGAALLHVTTRTEYEAVAGVAPHVPRTIVPCGVHTEAFAALPRRELFRDRHLDGYDGPVVTFLGRVTFKKGLDVLIRAFALARRDRDCRLAIVGPDDEGLMPALTALVRELGLGRDVAFPGPLYGQERLEALAGTDLWAMSSHTENFGIAVIEAMAAGCTVIVSPGVAISDEIGRAGAGVVADATPEVFGAALRRLLCSDEDRLRMRRLAIELAARYDWHVVGPQLVDAYQEVVSRVATRAGAE